MPNEKWISRLWTFRPPVWDAASSCREHKQREQGHLQLVCLDLRSANYLWPALLSFYPSPANAVKKQNKVSWITAFEPVRESSSHPLSAAIDVTKTEIIDFHQIELFRYVFQQITSFVVRLKSKRKAVNQEAQQILSYVTWNSHSRTSVSSRSRTVHL